VQVSHPSVQKFIQRFPFYNIVADEVRGTVVFQVGEDKYTVEEFVGLVLKHAAENAARFAGLYPFFVSFLCVYVCVCFYVIPRLCVLSVCSFCVSTSVCRWLCVYVCVSTSVCPFCVFFLCPWLGVRVCVSMAVCLRLRVYICVSFLCVLSMSMAGCPRLCVHGFVYLALCLFYVHVCVCVLFMCSRLIVQSNQLDSLSSPYLRSSTKLNARLF
jgi:hypothetical protein